MNKNNLEVLRKIIAAVETGGQVYGQGDYGDFTEAYTNSMQESSITIGCFQHYGEEAKQLLIRIKQAGGGGFTEELNRYLDYSWSHLQINKNSSLAKTIVNVITTDVGKTCQDKLAEEQLARYCGEAQELGVTDDMAQGMCANFRHQGGYGALTRIVSKSNRPYTLDNLYRACQSDTGNQVGTYRSRQKFVYNAIKEHMLVWVDDNHYLMSGTVSTAEQVRKNAVNWMINLAEDDSHGYDQIYRWGERGDYDCSSAVITAYREAGVPLSCTYTGNMKSDMLRNGFKDVSGYVNFSTGSGMIAGDVLLNEVHHTAMYIGDGQEVEASINEKGTATGGRPGDQTGREILIRSYRNYPWDCVLRYGGGTVEKYRPVLRLYDRGDAVSEMQFLLNENGSNLVVDGDFGQLTLAAVKEFQMRHLLEIDGIVGENTWYALDNQVTKVLRTPGVIRENPRKSSTHIKSLSAGDKVRVFELMYNEKAQKWCRVDIGWIIANNLENPV